MANYLHTASGTLAGSFPWSITAKSTSSESESQAETAWANGMANLFGDATLKTFIPSATELTLTSTSTADAAWRQTTKTTTTHALSGSSTGVAIGFDAATIVSLRSALSTRYGRGRWYLPGLASNALATGGYFYSSAATAALSAAVSSCFTQFSGAIQIVILHPHGNKSGSVTPFSFTPVTGGNVSDQVASQRRRADKRVPIRTSFTV